LSRVFVILALCVYLASAHSWMQCADYTEENGRFWDASLCRGWPRNYGSAFQYQAYGFGADAGFNYIPSDDKMCQADFGTADAKGYNSPTYKPGQRVCLAWPPKNHVAANCANANIPDSGTQIYISGINPTRDPTRSEFKLLHDFGASKSGAGDAFQNCPDFCTNPDKALCTGCFNIPSDMAEGKYVFLWLWAFNNANDLYSTCFDVTISKSITVSNPTTYSKITPDAFLSVRAVGTTVVSSGSAVETSGSSNVDGGSSGYSGGSIAAAVILTLIAVVGIFVGVAWYARTYPHSKLGVCIFGFLEPSANPRREALLS